MSRFTIDVRYFMANVVFQTSQDSVLDAQCKDVYHHSVMTCHNDPLLTCSSLGCGHVLYSLHAPSSAHDNDLLTPSCPDNLLTSPRHPLGLVDHDGLLPAHSGHLHPRSQGLGLTAHGDQVGAQSPHLCGPHTRLVDH